MMDVLTYLYNRTSCKPDHILSFHTSNQSGIGNPSHIDGRPCTFRQCMVFPLETRCSFMCCRMYCCVKSMQDSTSMEPYLESLGALEIVAIAFGCLFLLLTVFYLVGYISQRLARRRGCARGGPVESHVLVISEDVDFVANSDSEQLNSESDSGEEMMETVYV